MIRGADGGCGQYDGGNGAVLGAPMADPLELSAGATITFVGSPSHPHMSYEYGSEILVPDLVRPSSLPALLLRCSREDLV